VAGTHQRRSWRDRLRSPTAREIAIGVATSLIVAAIGFGVSRVWGVLHEPAATGTITYERTASAFISRDDFYKQYVGKPAPASQPTEFGAVFDVRTSAQNASSCRLVWTLFDVRDEVTIGRINRPTDDVTTSSCNADKQVWLPWPSTSEVPSGTRLKFVIGLVAGSGVKQSATTKAYSLGGG
jgi:hypothetical protein